jgi:hypothetical protein
VVWFTATDEKEADRLKAVHMVEKHPGHVLIPERGWVLKE